MNENKGTLLPSKSVFITYLNFVLQKHVVTAVIIDVVLQIDLFF